MIYLLETHFYFNFKGNSEKKERPVDLMIMYYEGNEMKQEKVALKH